MLFEFYGIILPLGLFMGTVIVRMVIMDAAETGGCPERNLSRLRTQLLVAALTAVSAVVFNIILGYVIPMVMGFHTGSSFFWTWLRLATFITAAAATGYSFLMLHICKYNEPNYTVIALFLTALGLSAFIMVVSIFI